MDEQRLQDIFALWDQMRGRISRSLSPDVQQRIGASDIVQNAYKSLIRLENEGKIADLPDDEILNILWRICVRKRHRAEREHRAERRDVGREAALDEDSAPKVLEGGQPVRQPGTSKRKYDREADATVTDDSVDVSEDSVRTFLDDGKTRADDVARCIELVDGLPDHLVDIARMRLLGFSNKAIASHLDYSQRTIQRYVDRIVAILGEENQTE